jgi:hypothetical protein
VFVGLLCMAGCGGGSPAAPAPPPVAAPSITTSGDTIFVGTVVQFAATGTGPITWGGDSSSVATVDSTNGRISAVGIGRVTVWAQNAGGRTTRLLRSIPSYAGGWRGSYVLTGCQATGDFARNSFCSSFSQGQVLSMQFNLAQDVDRVTGQFALGSLQGSLNPGTVNDDGTLPIAGRIDSGSNTILLENLRASSSAPGTIQGRFDQVWGHTALAGTGRLTCEIRDVTRTSGGPAFTMFSRPEGLPELDLESMIRAVFVR